MFSIAGESKDFLLVDWLAELLFLFDTRRLLLNEFDITIDANGLSGRGRGETFDPTRHRLDHEVKAITYHGLKVEQTGQRWLAEVIVDI
jgi:SHS2 domain-containing protein